MLLVCIIRAHPDLTGKIQGTEEQRGKEWSCGVQEGTSEEETGWGTGRVALEGCGELLLLQLLRQDKMRGRRREMDHQDQRWQRGSV